MAASVKIQVGNELPLAHLIPDGDTGLYPQVTLYDSTHSSLGTVDLESKANGYYAPGAGDEENMPDEPFIYAVYIVYTDAGHTTESSIYLRDLDTFLRDEAPGDVWDALFASHQTAGTFGRLVKSIFNKVGFIIADK